jgi:general secretion pathway protein K
MVTNRTGVTNRHGATNRHGVALIFVLWLLVLIGLAAAEVVTRARTESAMVTDMRARALGQYAAESGILLTTSTIESLLDSATTPAQRAAVFHQLEIVTSTPREEVLGTAHFAVALIDLNARLDVNRTDAKTLATLFGRFTGGSADDIVAALKRQPVSRFPELARVPGIDDELALDVAPYVTVWGDGLININSAPEPVLASIATVGKTGAQSIIARRENGVLTSADGFRGSPTSGPVAIDAPLLTIAPSRIMLVSRGWQPGTPLTHEIQAVYLVISNRLILQSWEERDR